MIDEATKKKVVMESVVANFTDDEWLFIEASMNVIGPETEAQKKFWATHTQAEASKLVETVCMKLMELKKFALNG